MATLRSFEIPRAWTLVLVIAAAYLMSPFVGWVILAIWLSGFARGLHERLARRFGGRVRLAAFVTVVIMMSVLIPLGVVLTLVIVDAIDLLTNLAQSDRAHEFLVNLVSPSEQAQQQHTPSIQGIGQLILSQGERAWGIVKTILSSAAQAIIGLVVLVAGMYSMLIEGRRWYAWVEEHAPMGPLAVRRFAMAFTETGKGLMFGILGAGTLQAIAATIAFMVLDVPQSLALGLLTLVFSLVPAVGTALVWVPVAAGLAITGRMTAGIGLAIYGILVIGSLDNLARPWLTRYGKLQLPGFIVLVSMFGAVEIFGGWGILFGPLIVRLAKEALEIRREPVLATPPSSPSP